MTNSVATEKFNLAEALWESMESGLAPWQKTWKGGAAPGRPANFTSTREYRSGNSLYLMYVAIKNDWSSKWISFVEANKLGGNLKGQKASRIEVPLIRTEVDKTTGQEKEILKGFRTCAVFYVDQVADLELPGQTPVNLIESVAIVDRMLEKLVAHGLTYVEPSQDGGCWYISSDDKIGMPRRSAFDDSYEYYSSLVHEMAHSTFRSTRADREDLGYAYEELRAEIASTLICSTLDLPRTQSQVDNHAAYLKPWLDEFSDKKKCLLKAAADAQKIHDYLIDLAVL